jgi:hypothetical protein
MGYTIIDWLLLLKHSPCGNHDNDGSDFPLGPAGQLMKKGQGLFLQLYQAAKIHLPEDGDGNGDVQEMKTKDLDE